MENCNTNIIGNSSPSSKYQSVFRIHDKLVRDMPHLEWNEDTIIEWAAEAQSKIGNFADLIQKDLLETVTDYRICLPCDFVEIVSVLTENGLSIPQNTALNKQNLAFNGLGLYYYIDNSRVFINFTHTNMKVRLSYLSIPTDEDGLPLVCENSIEAIYYYCIFKLSHSLWLQDKISENKFRHAQGMWNTKKHDARGNDLSPEKLKFVASIWMNMAPTFNAINRDLRYADRKLIP